MGVCGREKGREAEAAGARAGGGGGGGAGVAAAMHALLRRRQLSKDAPLPEFWRARAAAASAGEMVKASTPPLFLSSSSKDASVAPGRTYTT